MYILYIKKKVVNPTQSFDFTQRVVFSDFAYLRKVKNTNAINTAMSLLILLCFLSVSTYMVMSYQSNVRSIVSVVLDSSGSIVCKCGGRRFECFIHTIKRQCKQNRIRIKTIQIFICFVSVVCTCVKISRDRGVEEKKFLERHVASSATI